MEGVCWVSNQQCSSLTFCIITICALIFSITISEFYDITKYVFYHITKALSFSHTDRITLVCLLRAKVILGKRKLILGPTFLFSYSDPIRKYFIDNPIAFAKNGLANLSPNLSVMQVVVHITLKYN